MGPTGQEPVARPSTGVSDGFFLMHWSINYHFLLKNKQPNLLFIKPWKYFCSLCCCPGGTDEGLLTVGWGTSENISI